MKRLLTPRLERRPSGAGSNKAESFLRQFGGVLLGGIIGVAGTLGATWMNNYFAERREQQALFRQERRVLYERIADAASSLGTQACSDVPVESLKLPNDFMLGVELLGTREVIGAYEYVKLVCTGKEHSRVSDSEWCADCALAVRALKNALRSDLGVGPIQYPIPIGYTE